jgi:hypothetical protein
MLNMCGQLKRADAVPQWSPLDGQDHPPHGGKISRLSVAE